MSYQALLFCQDEKTARTVTQVLSELDFKVEACSETFAAVKKLTSQAFEAVVVDCQNEENAGLLLKTARNSASNQTSLMVAVVEGQAGVAAAFRIGANLVLTKPIAIEQARGTLRVARGLLRRNTIAAPSGAPAQAPAPVMSTPAPAPVVPPTPAPVRTQVPPPARIPAVSAPAARPIPPQFPTAPRAIPSAPPQAPPPAALHAAAPTANVSFGKLETESEHQPQPDAASAGLLEALDFKTFESAPLNPFGAAAAETEIVSVSEINAATPGAVQPSFAAPSASSLRETSAAFGAATAPAREMPNALTHAPSALVAPHFEPTTSGRVEAGFNAPHEAEVRAKGTRTASGSKTPLIAGVLFVVVAVALYFGWSQMHKPASPAATVAPIQPPAPDYPTPGAATQTEATVPAHAAAADSQAANPSQASTEKVDRFSRQPRPVADDRPVAQDRVAKDRVAAAPVRSGPQPAQSEPLQVKQLQHVHQPSTGTSAATQDAPEPPSITGLGATARPEALNTIAHSTAAALPAIAPQTHNISQGVTSGMLLKRVQPVYPAQALQMHIQGTVSLRATIGKDGLIKDVKVLSGPATLARAATEAVHQWKYRPYTLNGEPVEIQTDININFVPPK